MKRTAIGLVLSLVLSLPFGAVADPPAQSGHQVFRGEFQNAFRFWDNDSGLQVIFGASVADFCMGIAEFETFDFQDVVVDEEAPRILTKFKGEVYTEVWGFAEFDCARYLAEMPIAWGTAVLRSNDNDLFAFAHDKNNFNSVGCKSNSKLSSPANGEILNFHFVRHVIWDGDQGDFGKSFTNISLH